MEISLEELQLATRNHGLPLEALRYPITPPGLHYLLTHFDIPAVDAGSFRLTVGGRVERELTLTLDELRARPLPAHSIVTVSSARGRVRSSSRLSVSSRSTRPPTVSRKLSGSTAGMSKCVSR